MLLFPRFYLLRIVTGLVINPVSHSILKVAHKSLLMNCRFEEAQNFLFLKENSSNNRIRDKYLLMFVFHRVKITKASCYEIGQPWKKNCYTLKSINVDTGIMRLENTHNLNSLHCLCINVVNPKLQIEKLSNLSWK